jgi:hypothetical protein
MGNRGRPPVAFARWSRLARRTYEAAWRIAHVMGNRGRPPTAFPRWSRLARRTYERDPAWLFDAPSRAMRAAVNIHARHG